jgi:predicted dehydrogenase
MSEPLPVRVGLIGAGSIARAHAIAYASARTYCGPGVPPVRLVRLADVDEALAKAAAARLGFEAWTTDWEAVVAGPDVDLVSIATPNVLHAPMAIAAAAAGKHVLCEKPLAATAAEGERMYRAAAAAGVVHAVNFNYRKVPAVRFIARLLREGRIGEVRQFRGVFLQDWGNEARLPRSWKFARAGAGAGALAGVGSHVIDLARHLVGELERVAATTATWIAERPVATTSRAFEAVGGETPTAPVDVDDSAYVLGRFAGGAIGTFELSRCAPGRKNHLALEIHGTRGAIVYDYERANEVQLFLDGDAETAGFRRILIGPAQDDGALLPFAGLGVGFAESIVFQVRDLLVAIAGGPPMTPDFYDGWRALAVAEAVLAAADRGWVAVPPPPARVASAAP